MIIRKLLPAFAALWSLLAASGAALAHPHVWVTMTSEVVFGPDGAVTGVRHAWTFDEAFSTFAVQGLKSAAPGEFTREELQPLAEVNVTSLHEYDYFTYATADGHEATLKDPIDYWLERKDGLLTLHFTLPFAEPVKARLLRVEVYDPTYFIDFEFAKGDPVSMRNAPPDCTLAVKRPLDLSSPQAQKLDESFFNTLSAKNYGEQFANVMAVTCKNNVALAPPPPAKTEEEVTPSNPTRPMDQVVRDRTPAPTPSPAPSAAPAPPSERVGPAPEVSGIVLWLLAKQAAFYRALTGLIRAAKTDGTALWTLLGLSFLYGIFHAAGPGHGKAVISSYLVANEETWRRGIALSFAAALFQALVAVIIVGIAAVLLGVTAPTMRSAINVIESASFALIALFGARLLWVKGSGLIAAWRELGAKPVALGAAVTEPAAYDDDPQYEALRQAHARYMHEHDHDHDHGHAHARHHGHDHHDHFGHSHGPEPEELAGPGGWRRGLAAVFVVGLRPCSGAILVLVFALTQGLFWAGVAATFLMGIGTAITIAAIATLAVIAKGIARRVAAHRAGAGLLLLQGIEVAAAALVMLFGFALLAGYMVTERMVGI